MKYSSIVVTQLGEIGFLADRYDKGVSRYLSGETSYNGVIDTFQIPLNGYQ
jgi:hypothetical protein